MGIRTTGFKSEPKRGCRAERLTCCAALWRVHLAPFSLSNIGSVASFWLARLTAPWLSFAPITTGLPLISSQPNAVLLQSYRRDALQSHKAVFDYTFSGFRPSLCQCRRLNLCLICRACDKWLRRSIYYVVHIHMAIPTSTPHSPCWLLFKIVVWPQSSICLEAQREAVEDCSCFVFFVGFGAISISGKQEISYIYIYIYI